MTDLPPDHTHSTATSHAPPVTSPPALRFDWHDWLPYLENEDMPLDQKQDLIETLWAIVLTFMDMGYTIKTSPETCGNAIDLQTVLETAVVHLETPKHTITHAKAHIRKEANHV